MRTILLAVVIAVAGLDTAMADEWVVEAHYPDTASLARAAVKFQHVIVDAKRGVLRVATDESGMRALAEAGLDVGIDEAATAKLRADTQRVAAARSRIAAGSAPVLTGSGYATIPGYSCFRSIDGTYATMDDLVAAHPAIASIDEIGPTWEKTQNPDAGYTMRAMHITNFDTLGTDPGRPKMAVYSSIHAREYAPAEVDTRFAEWLVNGYGTDPEATWLVDHNDFHLVLLANPDARVLAEQQIYQRKNMDIINGPCTDENEFSQPGIDLNRNFPFHWNILLGGGSDDDTCSQTFHGPYASGSNHNDHIQGTPEPETLNLFGYVAGTCDGNGNCSGGLFADRRDGPIDPPTTGDDGGAAAPADTTGFFVDIHSNAALVLWPWGDTSSPAPNRTALRTLGRRLAFFNGYTPEQSDQLYGTDGTTDDTMYGLLGVAGFTLETNGWDFFEDCDTFDSDTAPTNIAALRYAARALHAPYRLPSGPDVYNIAATAPQQGPAGWYVNLSATVDDSHYNQSNGTQTIYPIQAASAYVDVLPWDGRATPIALAASDGSFDSNAETVNGDINLAGLTPGRHMLYVEGVNTLGTGAPGTPNAIFVDVPVDPNDVIFDNGFDPAAR